MRTSEAHRYARFSAAAAALIAIVAGGYFVRRELQARRAARNAPAPVPIAVEKSSQQFSYSKQEGPRTIFTIRAAQATQFRNDSRAVLQDVWLTIYGATSARADNIHTQSCDYDQASGKIVCSGNVQMDFQSAEDAQRVAAAKNSAIPARIIHVETRGMTFDRDSGDAESDQPVMLRFPGGDGSAIGVKYHSQDGLVELLRDVKFNLAPGFGSKPPAAVQAAAAPLQLSGSSLQYQRGSGIVFLHGPVSAVQSPAGARREMHAGELTIELDTQMRARRMTAAGKASVPAELASSDAKGEQTLSADSFFADYSPAGWIENFRADGHVRTSSKDSSGRTSVAAATLEVKMAPQLNAPAKAKASGGVSVDAEQGDQRHFESDEVSADFMNVASKAAGGHATTHIKHAETPSSALLSVKQGTPTKSKANGSSTLVVSGRRFEMEFDENSRMRQLQVHGAAKLDRSDAEGAPQTSTSDELAANLDEAGDWTQLTQTGHVKMRDAIRSAQGDRGRVDHATNVLALNGAAQVSDSDSQTSADAISVNQTSGEMHADGHVVTTYSGDAFGGAQSSTTTRSQASRGGRAQAAGTNHASAEHLVANSSSGKALFTGHARLWQGDATIEGDSVEIDRDSRQVNAVGNVHAIFVTQAAQANNASRSANGKASPPQIWRVRAPKMTYSDPKLLAHLEGGFTAESQQMSIAGTTGDLYFARAQTTALSGAVQSQPGPGTSLDHAVASQHVTVKQGDRHGAAELGQYVAADQKFTLSGGHPTFTDAAGNTTTGRELTFYLANDTILVQSEEGTRPQPRHLVEK